MKKLLVMLLACLMLLGMAGCKNIDTDAPTDNAQAQQGQPTDNAQEQPADNAKLQPGQTSSDYAGIEIRIDALYGNPQENTCELSVELRNQTQYDVTYGESFTVERLTGDSWISCAKEGNWAFEAIGYALKPGSSQTKSYNLSFAYDLSVPGTYRFRTECYVSDDPERSTKCTLTAEFERVVAMDLVVAMEPVDYKAQYIRTNGGYTEDVAFPSVQIIESAAQLQSYYDTWRHVFYLENPEKVYADTSIGFLDACAGYDEAFFEKNYLLFVLLEEGSGSIRHEVQGVAQTADQRLSISIDRIVPEVGTDDMAQWHIILELSRENAVKSAADTEVYLDGRLAYQDGQVIIPIREGAFKEPPKGILITPEGEVPMQIGGYSWFCQTEDGLMEATIADQAGRPLPKEVLQPVTVPSKYAETIYLPILDSSALAPSDMQGYLLKVHWEDEPTYIQYTCWPEAVWEGSASEKIVYRLGANTFYAKPGGYVYEITATWADIGEGYHGTANYYVYIVGE